MMYDLHRKQLQQSLTDPNKLTSNEELQKNYPASGFHMMADVWGASKTQLNDVHALQERMKNAIVKVGATLLKLEAVQFEPNGVTIVAVLAESHASIHTYPEKGVLMADAFTCGDIDPEPLLLELVEGLGEERVIRRTARGDSFPCHIEEELSPGLSRIWELQSVIAQKKTDYQNVLIARTHQGVTLFCNQERQSSELTQLIYHEGQFIPAALLASECQNVLIIGSSEGVITQLAQWCGAQRVVHVDIDRECVELCAEHLPYGYKPFDVERYAEGTPEVQLIFADGFETVRKMQTEGATFDIIVMDLPDEEYDPNLQHNRLYEPDFLRDLQTLLTPQGVLITQAGCASYWRNQTLLRTYQRFSNLFPTTVYFEMTEQDWVWVIGCRSKLEDPLTKMQARLKNLDYTPEYIDSKLLGAATVLPTGLRRLLNHTV
ncbi:adenosylmethionine decarboxylase [Xenorhabdus budapestensis]|uniref:Polyamine aminopropyltransferase n=1 Tax=Xenorhabdus budapestensis TaxID=290110 RepID=A0A2D0IU58_XENBU|nr:adenosylmethionine decarboxylase [Xenorhabdus budapestensis]PHM25434.1 spermidine synthase [Xenorhabdus budapestensis]